MSMFSNFSREVAKASGQVVTGAASRIESNLKKDLDKAVRRATQQVERDIAMRSEELFLGLLFSNAAAPEDEKAASTGANLVRGFLAPPADDSTV